MRGKAALTIVFDSKGKYYLVLTAKTKELVAECSTLIEARQYTKKNGREIKAVRIKTIVQ